MYDQSLQVFRVSPERAMTIATIVEFQPEATVRRNAKVGYEGAEVG